MTIYDLTTDSQSISEGYFLVAVQIYYNWVCPAFSGIATWIHLVCIMGKWVHLIFYFTNSITRSSIRT